MRLRKLNSDTLESSSHGSATQPGFPVGVSSVGGPCRSSMTSSYPCQPARSMPAIGFCRKPGVDVQKARRSDTHAARSSNCSAIDGAGL